MKVQDVDRFAYSVVRFVADPVRDEAINIGVIVVDASRQAGRMRLDPRRGARIRALAGRAFSLSGFDRAVSGLGSALGLERPLTFGAPCSAGFKLASLETLAGQFANQLQLTPPRWHVAPGLDIACDELFRLYIGPRRPRPQPAGLTRADVKAKVWQVVRHWETDQVKVERDKLVEGTTARHPADVAIRNGHLIAAMMALPSHPDERGAAYIYRDSLPAMAKDLHPAEVYAVIGPDPNVAEPALAADGFVEETRTFLQDTGVRTIGLSEVANLQGQLLAGANKH